MKQKRVWYIDMLIETAPWNLGGREGNVQKIQNYYSERVADLHFYLH